MSPSGAVLGQLQDHPKDKPFETARDAPLNQVAHSGHRDHSDRLIVITPIDHRDRSEATLASFS